MGLGFIAIALSSIGLPIAGVIAGVVALIGIFTGLYATNERFRDNVNRVFGFVKDFVTGVIRDVVSFVQERVQVLTDFWNANSEQIMLAWENAFNMVLKIIEWVMPIAGFILGGFVEGIKHMFSGLMTFIQGLIQIFTGIFTGDWSMMWEGLKNILFGAVEFIWGLINVTFLGRIVKIVTTFSRTVMNLIKNFVSGKKAQFTNIMNFVLGIFPRIMNAITGAFRGARNQGLSIIESMKAGLSGAWTSIHRMATTVFNNVKDAIFKPIQKARDLVRGAVDNIIGLFQRTWVKADFQYSKAKNSFFQIDWGI
jgi:phage-related protein